MSKSDPSNIAPLQKRYLNCLLSTKTAALLAAYNRLEQTNQENDDLTYQQPTDYLIPAISASIYQDIKACTEKHLSKAYRDGQYSVIKKLGIKKPAKTLLDLTIQRSLKKSYNLIKSSLIRFVSGSYSTAHAKPEELKQYMQKQYNLAMELIALTESMRQKVSGAVDALKEEGIKDVVLKAEYKTAGDSKVCPQCASLEGKIMGVDELADLIPQHPRCRCWFDIIEAKSGSSA
jgi:SPP1 gp7 family putative phage head morphogenesis protein